MDTTPAISVNALVKNYGDLAVLKGLSFTVARGETYALLGPNGAGKSTTVEILEGYRPRDGGTIEVLGVDPRQARPIGAPGSGSCCRRPTMRPC